MKNGRPTTDHIFPVPKVGSRLTPLEWLGYTYNRDGTRGAQLWLCECTCGEKIETVRNRIVKGFTMSCGCLRREMGIEKMKVARAARTKKKLEREAALLPGNCERELSKETK